MKDRDGTSLFLCVVWVIDTQLFGIPPTFSIFSSRLIRNRKRRKVKKKNPTRTVYIVIFLRWNCTLDWLIVSLLSSFFV